MTTQASDTAQAIAFGERPAVRAAIAALLAELETARSALTGVRGPVSTALGDSMVRDLARYGELKGRGPYFPYLGSGLGNGPLVELADGSVKWDMISGIGVYAFGHGDGDLAEVALRAALADVVMQGNLQYNREVIEFSDTLLSEASRGTRLAHCFLTNSGAMANESALKICYQKNAPASRVIAFEHCFMGRSTALSQIGDSAGARKGLPLNVLVDYLPFHDAADAEGSRARTLSRLDTLIARYPGQHACLVVEPVQGEGGFNTAPAEYLRAVFERCRAAGIAVWADEVQTFGRTEALLHVQQLEIGGLVDVVTIGKMSQVCACLFTSEYNPQPGLLSGTFIASTVGLAVGRRIIERMVKGGYYGSRGRNALVQRAFRSHMERLVSAHPEWFPPVAGAAPFGGVGGMLRFTPFGGEKAAVDRFVRILFDEGVIAFPCGHGPYHVRFLPPVGIIEQSHLADVFEIVERALTLAADAG